MKKNVTTNSTTSKVSTLSKEQAQQVTGGGIIVPEVTAPGGHTHDSDSQDIIAVLRRGIIAV